MQEIIVAIINSIEMILLSVFFGQNTLNYFNKFNINFRKIVIVVVFICLLTLNVLFCNGILKTILNFIIELLFFFLFFQMTFSLSIFVTFIYIVILMIPDIFIMFLLVNILNIPKDYYYNYFAGSFIGNLSVCVIMFLIIIIFKNKLKKVFISKIEKNNNIIWGLLFTIFSIIVLFFDIIANYKNNNGIISYVLLIIIFLSLIANLIKEKIVINDKIQEYNGLLGFMKSYESEIEENKIQNHEIKNQFLTIESMLMDNAPKYKIVNYVKSVIKDNEDIDDTRYTDLQYLPLNGIKGFICSKLNKAEKENLNVSIIVEKGVENSVIGKLSTKDFKKLGILLGVYLDNAIEASSLSEKRCLGIEIYLEKYGVIIIITNTFENAIKSNEENNKRISTKGIGRGHGLQLVNKVVSGNKKFEVKSEVIEKAYVQKIMIKK